MISRTCFRFAAVLVWLGCGWTLGFASEGLEFFEQRVRPVLAQACYECHSAEAKQLRGKLRLDSPTALRLGGESGAVIIPGKPDESRLIQAVRSHDPDLRMPPPEGAKGARGAIGDRSGALTARQIEDLVAWVSAGAPLPADPGTGARSRPPAPASHWAFQPAGRPMPPRVRDLAWVKSPVDRFILAKLEGAGLRPAPPADPRTLIRRVTFDLTGVPPTPEEVEAFQADRSTDAYARLVDRLLASARYGERWGRQWLDLARYSDTKGYVYGREERFFVHASAYRDWVVRALNEDLPYNRFLLLQIAADQLVPSGSPDLAAMGFLTGGRRFIGVTRDIIDDRIDVVMRGTMALTVACARCHDHKYDPIPTQDYYSLYGVFAASAEQLVRLETPTPPSGGNVEADFEKEYSKRSKKLADTMRERRTETANRLRARVADYLGAQLELQKYPEEGFDQILTADDLIPHSVRRWRDYLRRTEVGLDPIFAPWQALAKLAPALFQQQASATLTELWRLHGAELNSLVVAAFATAPNTLREAAEVYGRLFADAEKLRQKTPEALSREGAALLAFLEAPGSPTTVPDTGIINNDLFFTTAISEELWKLQGEVDRWLIQAPASPPQALVLADREPEKNPCVFLRGNPARPGEEVPRQFPAIVAGPGRHPFQRGSGRLELAQAIVSEDNPLTARVMVNRIWQNHFGAGLVRTPSDFGMRADPPSHPELLDWLAHQFRESGWSLKAMHRLLVLSATYQQRSEPLARTDVVASNTAELTVGALRLGGAELDPENKLLAHFSRVRLDFEQMRDAALAVSGELDGAVGGKPMELLTSTNRRRTLYGLVDRQFLPATFRVFDFANPDLSMAQRHATVGPQQALFFLNHTFVADRARALARGPAVSPATPLPERVQQLIRALFQRAATAQEIQAAERFIASAEAEPIRPPAQTNETAWRYGWGEYDASNHRIQVFQALPHFTGKAWQGGANFPDGGLGWVQLTATGGHPGNDLQHAVIRRWTAPIAATVSVAGEVVHEPEAGDGIRAFIVSSRWGELKAAALHHHRIDLSIPRLEVQPGDTLDFIVDIAGGLNSDQFLWAPRITALGPDSRSTWDAQKEFSGPPPVSLPPLLPWEQYAQVLLLANEFLFLD